MTNKAIRKDALDLLARREHSQLELTRKLLKKGHAATAVAAVVAKLAQENLQSDVRYLENYIRYRRGRGFGPRAIQYELQQRGLTAVAIQSALADPNWQWSRVLHRLWSKKFDQLPVNQRAYLKQYRFLLQRGFEPDRVRTLLRDSEHGIDK